MTTFTFAVRGSHSTRRQGWIPIAWLIAASAGCQSDPPDGDPLAALPEAKVLLRSEDGVPQYIVGHLGQIDLSRPADTAADASLRPALPAIVKAFRLSSEDLVLRKVNTDERGARHYRYDQRFNNLDVVGGDLVVHVEADGRITGINGTARGDIAPSLGGVAISEDAASASIVNDARWADLTGRTLAGSRMVYVHADDGSTYQAYEQIVEGERGADPVRDKVFVDVETGRIVAVHPTIHHARNRNVYSANNGTSLPGTLKRSEGQGPTTDTAVNNAFDNAGAVYNAYNFFFGRDSYNNAGATLNSTVHYSSNYCNAFWDGARMVYGDGNASQGCAPLANAVDVAGHEITHAVTEYESGLIYSGESGGLNESYSDIFAAFIEAYVDGGSNGTLAITPGTFLIGEDVLPPFLRDMCDPAADGISRDIWSSGLGGVDVHYSSGPNNLAFCLLVKGGSHPRGKTAVVAPAIGFEKAIRIFYKANVDILTSSSNYAAMRLAAINAASQLGYDQATKESVACVYSIIGIAADDDLCPYRPKIPPPLKTPLPRPCPCPWLISGIPDINVADVAGNFRLWQMEIPAGVSKVTFSISGGAGDADIYVNRGSAPSGDDNLCHTDLSGSNEACTLMAPSSGTYWVGLHAFGAYSGVTLKGTIGTQP